MTYAPKMTTGLVQHITVEVSTVYNGLSVDVPIHLKPIIQR